MPQSSIPILSLLTFLPLVGVLIIMALRRSDDLPDDHHGHDGHDDAPGETENVASTPKDSKRTRINAVALLISVIQLGLGIYLFQTFDPKYSTIAEGNMQFIEQHDWITVKTGGQSAPVQRDPRQRAPESVREERAAQPMAASQSRPNELVVQYHMGVDGISVLLILLTTFLMLMCVIYSFGTKQRHKEFMAFLLMLETGMIGVFCALDLVLFYIFWEAMLIPMYFLIGIFGHENRIYAAVKFFLYTFAGSILMLIAIVWIYSITGTFDLLALSNPNAGPGATLDSYLRTADNARSAMMLFGAFALAFAIKVPMFPFHTWLPDAHVEAPTAGSVILAGVMLKMGTYGFVRFCLPLFPQQAQEAAWLFIALAIIGIVYGSIVAAVQPDAKKLVAYSSVAHLGFVILGIFSFTQVGMMGALIQNINHGISTPMLFFMVGMLYDRRHTRQISEYGGLKLVTPLMATLLLIAVLSSIAVPFFNGFVGEFPILVGSFISNKAGAVPTLIAATGMIWSAVYMLWWFGRIMLGPVTKPANRHLPDLRGNEFAVLWPLAGLVFWIGLGSHFFTSRMDTAVNLLVPPGDILRDQTNRDLPIAVKIANASGGSASGNPTGRSIREQFSEQIEKFGDKSVRSSGPPGGFGGGPGGPGGGGFPGRPPGGGGGAAPFGGGGNRPAPPSGENTPPVSDPSGDPGAGANSQPQGGNPDQPVSSPPSGNSGQPAPAEPANPNTPTTTPGASGNAVPGNPGGNGTP
jgi:NADH-quinone oxidoreductase subunit M